MILAPPSYSGNWRLDERVDVLDADNCGGETDILYAGRGNDWLLAADGDARDVLYGEKGFDTCVVGLVEARSGAAMFCERVIIR